MKKVLTLAVAVLLFFSCKEQKRSTFTVSGTITGAPGNKVLLMETPYANAQPLVLDSATLKNDGSFSMHGRASEEGIFKILPENGPAVYIINDNNNIRLQLDVADYRHYKVEGSPASQSLHDLFEDYRTKDSLIFATFRQMENLRSQPGQDSMIAALQKKNDRQVNDLNALLRNFIENAESPATAYYALGMADQTMDKEEVKKLIDYASAKFPKHEGLARIKRLYAAAMNAREKKEPTEPKQEEEGNYFLLNKQAPDLTMADVNGKPVSISDFKGKYVLVDFWASWCGPCRQENPAVVAAYRQFKNKNFTVLGVSLDASKEAWKKAIAADNLTWTHMSDLKQWQSAAVPAYGIQGIPFNVLIDPSGKIIASSLRGEELVLKLKEVLK